MTTPFITGRAALNDAAKLIDTYGDDAGFEAASRAEHSRRGQCAALLPLAADRAGHRHARLRRSARNHSLNLARAGLARFREHG
jgi:hypothetical protein